MSLEKKITEIFINILDTSLNLTITDMGVKSSVTILGHQVSIQLRAGFPIKFLPETLIKPIHAALKQAFPAYTFIINLEQFISSHKTQLPGSGLRGVKNTIAIASGKGGVGKSTVAVNLAIALARAGARVGILDADIYGPSIPLMLGKTTPVQVENERYLPVQAHGIQAMSIGYLTAGDGALIWRGPMLAKSLMQLIDITVWDELDYLFIDLPPGTGDIQLSLVQKIPLAGAVVVTTPQTVATLDAQKALHMFEKTNIHTIGLIENMSLHTCSTCGHQEPIFGTGGALALAETFQCQLLGQLPLNATIGLNCDEGQPTASQENNHLADTFIQTAMQTAIALSKRPFNYADKFPPIVVE